VRVKMRKLQEFKKRTMKKYWIFSLPLFEGFCILNINFFSLFGLSRLVFIKLK
jgi:hypothetical protein